MNIDCEFTLLIPCLNEEKTLSIVLERCRKTIEDMDIKCEILVSDNGSSDQSIDIALSGGARVVHCPIRGYGSTLKLGIREARGAFIIFGDADGSYDFGNLSEFIMSLRDGFDVVQGTRLQGVIEKGAMPFLNRYLGTPVLTFLINLFFKTKVTDVNCGLRGLKKNSFFDMQFFSTGMEFATEIIILSKLRDHSFKEVPIHFYRDLRNKPPHMRRWRDGWRHLRLIMIYAPNYLFIYPGLFLSVTGVLVLITIIFFHVQVLGHFLDFHFSILGSLLVLLGFQIILMGIFSKVYGIKQGYLKMDFLGRFLERYFSLESGLGAGGLMFLFGISGDLYILFVWISNAFGPLRLTGLAILASTLMIVGIMTFFTSFLITTLRQEVS